MSLNDILVKQAIAAEVICKSISNFKKTALNKRTKGVITERQADIKKLWAEYTNNHYKITQLAHNSNRVEDLGHEYFVKDQYSEMEEKYYEFIGCLRDALISLEPPTSPSENKNVVHDETQRSDSNSSFLKLPHITLPKFSGSYESWRSFHDLFHSLVHTNPALPPVQKLHYLKTSVSGEAEHLLRQFPITNASYYNAWKLLVDRYDNKRVLVNAQLKTLCNIPKLTFESAKGIKSLLDKPSECIYELEALGVSTKEWDPILIHLLVQCLPTETHRMWEQEMSSSQKLPTLEQFKGFLEKRFRTLEAISESKHGLTSKSTDQNKYKAATHFTSTGQNCPACKESHHLCRCPKFVNLSIDERYKFISKNNLCANCLSKNHKLQFCTSRFTCKRCGRKHHSLLHKNNPNSNSQSRISQNTIHNENKSSQSTPSTSKDSSFTPLQSFHAKHEQCTAQALLATALVNVASKSGTIYTMRALIDSGSQVSFITQAAAQKLQLPTSNVSVQITGLGKSEHTNVRKQTSIKISSQTPENKPTTVNALIVQKITDLLPPSIIQVQEWVHIKNLHLADPHFNKPGKIDILLGAEVYSDIILEGLQKGPPGTPTAQNSTLGWILFGNLSRSKSCIKASSLTINAQFDKDASLDSLLRKFWESEEVVFEHKHSTADRECEEFYDKTHIRNANGRYEVRLPFINQKPELGDSRNMALRRFYALERKLTQNPELRIEYSKCLQEYETLGHMRRASREDYQKDSYYLPHHAVFKDSTTTKVRVVFDASAKSTNGKGLNEQLHTGPVLQPELFTTLLRWRKYKFAMSADVEKMYRMINIQPQDQKYQKIVWRNNPSDPVKDYVLTTVTFGTTPAPYLAIKSLHQLAKDEAEKYPIASQVAVRDFYVDDLMTGADSIDEALIIQDQLLGLLRAGGFNLRKWVSNASELLENIPEEHREIQLPLRFASDDAVKTLGIHWYPGADYFTLQHRQIADRSPTKRSVLSEIATLFDPLGWISPIIVTGKILMQALWLCGCSWDDPIPVNLDKQWHQFKAELHLIEQIRIPRWLHTKGNFQNCQIHGFSDASNHAYSAVVYIRVIDEEQNVHVNILMAKTKIAPVKPVSLPRLELCGAVLLTRLIKRTKTDLNLNQVPIYAWTDSSIALSWIRNHPNKYKTFVANRIAEIQDCVDIKSWQHVRSEDNPADCNSRGIKPSSLISNNLWWHGPKWLKEPEEKWPKLKLPTNAHDGKEQKRSTHVANLQMMSDEFIKKFSSYTKLLRTIAYCFRFSHNCRQHKKQRILTHLSTDEIKHSKLTLIKLAQQDMYHSEIKNLRSNQPLSSKSAILSLNPFLDEDGILRVGGRLQNSNIPYSQKHPILLPKESHLTFLLINYYHFQTLHGGTQLVLTTLRHEFWIPQGRRTVRNIIHKCITCFKQSPRSSNQFMGNLPSSRVNISRPFQHTGIDYAGPIHLRMSKHRGNRAYKGYICIFICMATKAIHIEPVSDLSTAAFIAAFKRFVSRRGLCSHIYSDCGTNFVGANKVLKNEYAIAIKKANQTIAEKVAHEGIQWHFNPPSAPHFGGLWEAGVKSIKFHLRRVLGNSLLTYEEFATVLAQIEACLNSRPLCPASDDPDDAHMLTPGHFLIGSAIIAPPESGTLKQISAISRWNYLNSLQQHFWSKWSKDYLNLLQNRPKWKLLNTNPNIGELVILKEDNLPPSRWLIGRIIEIHPGTDDLVRVVTVKTKNGIFKRPISKICQFPKN